MIYGEDYGLGIACFVVAAAWTIVCWLYSDPLKRKLPKKLKANPTEKQIRNYRQTLKIYRAWKWTGIAMPILAVAAVAFYAEQLRLKRERDEVFNKLSIEYLIPPNAKDDPLQSIISITNNSSQWLSPNHRISCTLNELINDFGGGVHMDGIWTSQNENGTGWLLMTGKDTPITPLEPIHPGGDASSNSCISGFTTAGHFSCADLTIRFEYFLQDQPTDKQEKSIRLVTFGDKINGFEWRKESLEARQSRCARFIRNNRS